MGDCSRDMATQQARDIVYQYHGLAWTSLWILKLEVVPKNVPWHLAFARMAAAEGTFEISFDDSLD